MKSSSSSSGSLESSFAAASMPASGEDISKLLPTLMDGSGRIFSVLISKKVLRVARKLCFSDALGLSDRPLSQPRFKLFCAITSASYGPCPLKDAGGSDSPRQRVFSGIHRQCHKDKTRLPSFAQGKEGDGSPLQPQHTENCPNFSSFTASGARFKSSLL